MNREGGAERTAHASQPQPIAVALRPWRDDDSVAELTALLHRAYANLLRRGLRFEATQQDESRTRARIAEGSCWVAELDGAIVGTVTFRSPEQAGGCPFFDRPEVATFHQLAVSPELHGRGIGATLLELCERLARESGAAELVLDTAEPAADLCAYYAKRGYRFVDFVQWPDVNYRSVVLGKRLGERLRTDREGRFACDAMLGGLARWLRAAGHDADFQHGIDDAALVERARSTGRILLSSDSGIFERTVVRSGAVPALWIPRALDKYEQLGFVLDVLDLTLRDPPRCMDCNGELMVVAKESVRAEAPPRTYECVDEFWRCTQCGKLLWHGSHWDRILEQLRRQAGEIPRIL